MSRKHSVSKLQSKSQQQDSNQNENEVAFSVRKFLTSSVLMSNSTVKEKLDILYDIFDWADGTSDGVRMPVLE